jgi:hypothetical protein
LGWQLDRCRDGCFSLRDSLPHPHQPGEPVEPDNTNTCRSRIAGLPPEFMQRFLTVLWDSDE